MWIYDRHVSAPVLDGTRALPFLSTSCSTAPLIASPAATSGEVSLRASIPDGLDTASQQPYPFSRAILSPFSGQTLAQMSDGSLGAAGERETALRADYRHVFGDAYFMEEERAELAREESLFLIGALSIRDFVRALGAKMESNTISRLEHDIEAAKGKLRVVQSALGKSQAMTQSAKVPGSLAGIAKGGILADKEISPRPRIELGEGSSPVGTGEEVSHFGMSPISDTVGLGEKLLAALDVTIAEKEGQLVPHEGGSTNYDVAKASLDDVEEDLDESMAAKRFHATCIRKLFKFHVDASEAFDVAGVILLHDIIARFDDERATWTAVAKAAAEVDAHQGLSIASQDNGSGRMARQEVLPNSYPQAVLESRDFRHEVLAAKARGSFVANDVFLGGGRARIALVTGPNQTGKSTFSLQVAIAVILAQIGCYVPASSTRLRPVEALFARTGSRNDIARGRSTFLFEMEEAARIVNTASDTSLVAVDELFSGTSASDAHAQSHATLERLLEIGCLTAFCTHAVALAVEFAGRVGNFTVAANVNEAERSIVFVCKLVEDVTSESRGVFCARVAGVPAQVADSAERVVEEFAERRKKERRLRAFLKIATLGSLDDGALSLAKRVELLGVCS